MKLVTSVKAEAIAIALQRLTGFRPLIEDIAGRARIYWSDNDLPAVRSWFENQLTKTSAPAEISVDLLPVVGPYAAKSAAPAVLITLAVGVLLGRYL